ncbi:MAG: nucleotide-binding universal stress UspA family protein [Gammaproteobacteria bacterium]|jgi:nucleotide-binding universal stress UspA family protein
MKTLLVPFFDDDAAQNALDYAAAIAKRFNSHIEGLFVVRPPQVIDGEGMAMMASYVTQLEEEGERLAERAKARFDASLAAHGIEMAPLGPDAGAATASWREFEGLEGQVLGDYGRVFDLIIIGRGFGYPWSDWDAMCEAALFECGRPVLITPEESGSIGEHAAIAWNGSTETARTIALSMPLLLQSKQVTVISVEGWSVPGPDGEQMARHLQRNGIQTSLCTVALDGRTPGQAVCAESLSAGADLLIKGAYTQSRLRQLVFGGATRHILYESKLPVVMAH